MTEIDGLDIHFTHVNRGSNATHNTPDRLDDDFRCEPSGAGSDPWIGGSATGRRLDSDCSYRHDELSCRRRTVSSA